MKLIALAALIGLAAMGQENPPQLKHGIAVPWNSAGSGRVSFSARNIDLDAAYPSVIRLKGDVEIRTPQCFVKGPGTEAVCYGETIVRADEAEYHEDTGAIEAHGKVTVVPLQTAKK